MPPQRTPVQLNAPCLTATRDLLRLVTIKPSGHLTCSDTLGPHYGNRDRDEAVLRANAFLQLASEQDAELAVAPEYFMPIESLENVLRNPETLRQETVYVLPIESMDRRSHEQLLALGRNSNWVVRDALLSGNPTGTSFNSCAVAYRSRDRHQLFLQHKIYFSPAEEDLLIEGQEFFVFQGRNIGLVVLICSDANNRDFHQTWADAADICIMAHVQWNPRPDYIEHSDLWASILGHEHGESRLFISCNWANGSTIEGINGRIPRFRTRIFRRRSHLKPRSFTGQSQLGMHVEHRLVGSDTWEIWHSLSNTEHITVLDVARPSQNVHAAQLRRKYTVSRGRYFETSAPGELFQETIPRGLTRPFWELMSEHGVVDDQIRRLEGFTLYDLELIYNAGLMQKPDSWILKDVAYRLPTAPIICPVRDCNECAENPTACRQNRPAWEEEAQDFAECLGAFWASDLRTDGRLRIGSCSEYPLNLASPDGTPAGWLFYARGKQGKRLAKTLASLLKDKLQDSRRSIFLCGVGVGIEMPTRPEIYKAFRKIENPGAAADDITSPDHCAKLLIKRLR